MVLDEEDELREEVDPNVVEFAEDEGIELTDDGGAIISLGEEQSAEQVAEFYDNLVPQIDPVELDALATRLLQDIERDKKARELRDKQYAEAIRRTGLGKDAPGGADFSGASKAVHPMLAEAAIDFASRAIKELMPGHGPVKVQIPGEKIDQARLEKAERKKNYMNWQFTVQMPEFRSELEQLLTQLPLGGSMYLRLTPDYSRNQRRPVPVFVPIDYVSIPYSASNFYSAERQTYHEEMTEFEYNERVRAGMYIEVGQNTGQAPEETKAEEATNKIEGREQSASYNEDGVKIVHEVSTWHKFDSLQDGDGPVPYLISIDEPSRKIVSVVRNWEQDDEAQERMQWMVEFPFIPWRGAYSVGLGQFIGSLSGAATGALRALLDSAHIQNIPTLARLKGTNFTGQSKELSATQIVEIEGAVAGTADIRQLLMPIPFNPPSDTLFQLLGFLVEAGRGAIHTAFDKMAENNANMPVGTTLALIEEGMRVMSAIHLRLYHAMTYVIRILHRINKMYLTDEELRNDIGEVIAHRSDFQGPLDCIPSADPEVFSDVQRIAQAQIVADRAAALPEIYDQRATEEYLLERARIPGYEKLLRPIPKPEEMNQVNENVAMTLGQPVAAFPEQDHLAHLQVLLDFMTSPFLGMLPIIAPTFLPAALEHMKQHIVYWYVNEYYKLLQTTVETDEDGMKMILKQRDGETRKEMDQLLAVASPRINERAASLFQKIPAVIQQAQQILEQLGPQGPMTMPLDPNKMAAIEQKRQSDKDKAQLAREKLAAEQQAKEADRQVKIIDLQTRRQSDQEKLQLEFSKLSADERREALIAAREEAQQAAEMVARLEELAFQERAEDERAAAELESKERINTQDNLTALKISAAEIESGEKVARSTGTGANPNPSGSRSR